MAYSFSEKIDEKNKQIKEEQKKVDINYKKLGEQVSYFLKDKPFSYCLNELSNYEISLNEYNKILKKKNKLNNKVEQISEYNNKINAIRLALNEKRIEEQKELSRYGAAIFEAYSNDKIDKDVSIKLDLIFDKIHLKLNNEAKKRDNSNIILTTAYYERRLDKMKKSLYNLFIKSAQLVIDENLESSITLKNNDNYVSSIKLIIDKRKNLENKIKEYEKNIEDLKSGNSNIHNKKLEEMQSEIKALYETQSEAALLFGKELYNNLPDEISSKEIGLQAISIIDKITVQLAYIDSLTEDIKKLNNEIQISELSSQISLERKKIERLNIEIENCNSQITKIEDIIQKKINKIIKLKDAGVYEKSKFDLKLKDESYGK